LYLFYEKAKIDLIINKVNQDGVVVNDIEEEFEAID
jgi:hypothetical protein